MTSNGILQILVFFGLTLLVTKPLGLFMSRLFQGERTFLHPLCRPLEVLVYKLCGVRENDEQRWTQYRVAALVQPDRVPVWVRRHAAAGTPAAQSAGLRREPGEPRPGVQHLAELRDEHRLAGVQRRVDDELSRADGRARRPELRVGGGGIAVAIALIRGFARQETDKIGNFWVDLTRTVIYILLPLSVALALLFCSQGVIQNFHPYTTVKTVEGATQTIAQGPVASQEAIKQIGTNGGGFFNANSAHPFENPTPFTNFFAEAFMFAIGAGLTYTFGHMVKDTRQGWALFWAMSVMFLMGVFVVYPAEQAGNPIMAKMGVETAPTALQSGGNMEGKETRFGIATSALFATGTTDATCGAVNAMHDSFTPLGGLVPLFNIQTDEVIFGGVGSGLFAMLLYAIVGVFIAGLMVGRTPEYLGKKIQQKEVKMALFAILATSFLILVFSSISIVAPFAKGGYWNPPGPATANFNNAGPHGLSEVLYAYSSAAENNGSAFAGITVNTPWYDLTLGLAILFGRFLFMIPALAVAGSLARQKRVPRLRRHAADARSPVCRLPDYGGDRGRRADVLPALSLGPIVEHFLMHQGQVFWVTRQASQDASWSSTMIRRFDASCGSR